MKPYLQKYPNQWSCLPTAFAIAAGIHVDMLLEHIGHDGSEVVFTGKDPKRRRSFHIQEVKLALLNLDFHIMDFYNSLVITPDGIQRYGIKHVKEYERIVKDNTGVFTGLTPSGRSHAVAWSYPNILDPNGTQYKRGSFFERAFWLVVNR